MSRKTPEGRFKEKLAKELMNRFPGHHLFYQDSQQTQGIPDHLILYKDRWAMLESKKSESAARQTNQEYYVEYFNKRSFAAFINPENMEEVLDELESTFQTPR